VLSLLGMVLYQCLAYYAAHSTSATNMGVIGSLIPPADPAAEPCFFGQKPGKQALLGMSLSLFGVLWLLGQGNPLALLHDGINPGDGLMLLGRQLCPLWPADPPLATAVRPLAQPLPADPAGGAAADPGGPLLTPWRCPPEGWSLVLFAGLASSLFAAYCWMRGLATGGGAHLGFMNLMPLCTALIAVITLGEPIHGYHLLGGGLILTGVMLSQLKPRVRRPLPEGA
jgi:drug/metabolite transporter (DMT)-like permease